MSRETPQRRVASLVALLSEQAQKGLQLDALFSFRFHELAVRLNPRWRATNTTSHSFSQRLPERRGSHQLLLL